MREILLYIGIVSLTIGFLLGFVSAFGPPHAAFFSRLMVCLFFIPVLPMLLKKFIDGLPDNLWYPIYVAALIVSFVVCFMLMILEGLFDISYAIHKEYGVITGKADAQYKGSAKSYHQLIIINGEKYYNRSTFWQKAETGKPYTLKYLPNSKTVMEIIGPLPEETGG